MAERRHERGQQQLQLPLTRRAKGGAREERPEEQPSRNLSGKPERLTTGLVNAGRDRSVAYLIEQGEGERGAGRRQSAGRDR